ncbi:MAG TPA: hypothetical protein VFR63_07350 [Gaiellaceae bacterium]|nr:hypothetical protein [Gaiellaceae bacterium]
MTAPEEIGARVDALAQAHRGHEFVAAVQSLAAELGPEAQPLLRQILLERAADEDDFQRAVRRRFAEKGWLQRTYARLEHASRDERVERILAALEAGPAGKEALARDVELLRRERGKAALVLDELSRHADPAARGWVADVARETLGPGAGRVLLGLTRDRDAGVRERAVGHLLALDPEAARKAVPDLRRRLHSADADERVAAMWALAELGDRGSLPTLRRLADRQEPGGPPDAHAAAIACLALEGRADDVVAGLRAADPADVHWFAAAARIVGSEESLAALEACARDGSREDVRRAGERELEKARARR